MKEFTIGTNDAGQRLDRFLAKAVPLLPASLAQKYIRIKRIKRNHRLIVAIEGVIAVATSYIPTCFLEKVE